MALSRKVKKALKRAKELEKKEPMTKKELVKSYKAGISLSEKLRNFLKPSWFVKDIHKKSVKKKKKVKTKKTRKKKKVKRKKKKK